MKKRKLDILVIAGSSIDRNMFDELFGFTIGYETTLSYAESLVDSIRMVEKKSYDAVLMELNLPDSQGLDTLAKIKSLNADMPILVIDDQSNDSKAAQMVSAGAQDVLSKSSLSDRNLFRSVLFAIERKQTEVEDRLGDKRFRVVLDNMLEGVQIIGFDWKYKYLNKALEKTTGVPNSELLNRHMFEIWPGIEDSEVVRHIRKCLEQRVPARMENKFEFSDGRIGWHDLSIQPISQGAFIMSNDITERKLAAEAIRISEEKYRVLIENMAQGVIFYDGEGKLIDINPAAERITGRTKSEMLGQVTSNKEWNSVKEDGSKLPGSEYPSMVALRTGKVVENVVVGIRPDDENSYTWLRVNAYPRFNPGEDKPYQVYSTFEDITPHKQIEKEMTEKIHLQERLEKTAATVPGLICSYRQEQDGSTSMPYASPAILDVYGFVHMDVAGDMAPILQRILPEDLPHVMESIQESARAMTEWHAVYRYRHPTKGEIWVEGRSMPIMEENGGVIWHGYITDISERMKIEMQLRESENRLKAIIETTSDGFWLANDKGNFLEVNRAYSKMSGYSREELLQMEISDVDAIEKAEEIQTHITEVLKRGTHLFETRHRHKDGHIYDVEMSVTALSEGEYKLACFSRDITQRKQADLAIRQSAEDLSLINELNDAVSQGRDMEYITRILARESKKIFSSNGASFFLVDEEEQVLTLPGFSLDSRVMKFVEKTVGGQVPVISIPIVPDSLPWKYLQTENGTLTHVLQEIDQWIDVFISADVFPEVIKKRLRRNLSRIRELIGIRSLITMPLVHAGKTIGLLGITSRDHFQEDDMVRFNRISSHLTAAILRQKNEENLKISNERFMQLASNIREVFWMFDHTTKKMIYISPAYEEVWGRTPEDLFQDSMLIVSSIIPQDRHIMQEAIELQRQGKKTEVEYRITRADDEQRWIWDRSFPIYNEKGKLLRTAGLATDITDNKLAEMQLKEREGFLQSIVDSSPGFIVTNTLDGYFIYANKRIPTQTDEEFYATNIRDIVHPDFLDEVLECFHRAVRTGVFQNTEHLGKTMDGEYHWFEVVYSPVFIDGKVERITSFAYDIHERKMAQMALEESEGKYRLLAEELEERVRQRTAEVQGLYDNAPAGYHSLDSHGLIIMINQTELDWLGYARDEVVGKKNIQEIITPATFHIFEENYPIFKKQGWISDLEFEFIRKDGSVFSTLVNATAIYDSDGNYSMSRSTVIDNTQRKQAEAALRQSRDNLKLANEALEKAARLKDEFLASMSHELRTPLTGILGLSEVLLLHTYGDLNEKQENALKNIENSGRHLLDLINDILDLSKIEAGKLELHFELCSVMDICEASLQLTKAMANQKEQKVNFSTNLAAPFTYADPRRLKQMLVNLLSNAVKFTPEGGSIGLEVEGCEEDKTIKFSIWDTGIGIEEEQIPLLFKPFVQLDSGLARQHSGTGLGLSLVYRMAELHGGSLQVESKPGEGSRFTICLPWEPKPAQEKAQLLKGPEGLQSTLTVEDNEFDAEHITRYLSNLGIQNIVSQTGMNAVNMAARKKPDIILLDLLLPDKPGLEVLAELKADERTASIPVVITSIVDRQNEAYELGAAGYLLKPFQFKDIHGELSRVISETQDPDLVMLIAPHHDIPVVLIVDDNEITRQTISDYLKSQNMRAVTASSGEESLNIVSDVQPNIILMDIQMPGMDGLEVTRRLRSYTDPMVSGVPIIAITALAMSGDRERCLGAGANEYISKPFQMTKLLEVIKSFDIVTHEPKIIQEDSTANEQLE